MQEVNLAARNYAFSYTRIYFYAEGDYVLKIRISRFIG